MAIGIIGVKRGMTRVFTDQGQSLPVTVVEASPNRVTLVKTPETDGYSAVQVTAGAIKPGRVNKPAAGQFRKAQVEAGAGLWELRTQDAGSVKVGDTLAVGAFAEGQKVDVAGRSKGKGFAGVVKRHNFKTQDASHGNSLSHRAPGSIGQCQTPGRVFKGKKMAGHMGAARVTAQTLEVVKIDQERHLLLIKGAVPGATGGPVIVTPAVKASHDHLQPAAASQRQEAQGDASQAQPSASAEEQPSQDSSQEAQADASPAPSDSAAPGQEAEK